MANAHNGADLPFYDDALSDCLQHLGCLDRCLTGLEMLVHYHLAVLDTPEYIRNFTLHKHPSVRMLS